MPMPSSESGPYDRNGVWALQPWAGHRARTAAAVAQVANLFFLPPAEQVGNLHHTDS